MSFRRFCGLPLEVETPDHASIWRFRQTIDKPRLSVARSWLRSTSSSTRAASSSGAARLVDATLVTGAVRRPYESGGGVNPHDPDARFTRKRDKTYFGTKAHLAVDEERVWFVKLR